MNARQAWTDSQRRFSSCALSVLLAGSVGCLGESVASDPSAAPDSHDLNAEAALQVDSGAFEDLKTDQETYPKEGCVDPAPYADAGALPSKPYVDAGPPADDKPDAKPPYADAGVGRACFGQLMGDGEVCIPDVDFKLKAQALCESKGYILDAIKLDDAACAGGGASGWVSCCEPVPPAKCTAGVIGDGNTCIDLSWLKLKATEACDALGATLVGLYGSGDESCSSGALEAKYECCEAASPPDGAVVPEKEPWLK